MDILPDYGLNVVMECYFIGGKSYRMPPTMQKHRRGKGFVPSIPYIEVERGRRETTSYNSLPSKGRKGVCKSIYQEIKLKGIDFVTSL